MISVCCAPRCGADSLAFVLRSLVSRRHAGTHRLVVVERKAFAEWLALQEPPVAAWVEASGFSGQPTRVLAVPSGAGIAFVLVGKGESGPWSWASVAQRLAPGRYAFEAPLAPEEATWAAIGWALETYGFDRYRSVKTDERRELVWPVGADRAEVRRVVDAVGLVRDLINTPAAELGPEALCEAGRTLGERYGARTSVVQGARLEREYPAVHAVGRGSARKPRLLNLSWGKPGDPRVTLVGKGVCFDSGGLDLKNPAGMLRMKKDMGGAAHALGLAGMIMDAGLAVRLRVLIPAVENLPGPHAYRPGDVIRTRKGVTVEVTNTDAEGRLVLADALAEADREKPELLIDLATLTGAARLALGTELTPFFASQSKLADELGRHGRAVRDPVWRLPLHRGYRRHLESRVADLKNAPTTHLAGAITAALFLREFVAEADAWLHVDLYGWSDHARPGRPLGGDATGMRALWALLKDRYPARRGSG